MESQETIHIWEPMKFIEYLHEKIRNGDMKTVSEILNLQDCHGEHIYNQQMESAAATAIKFERYEIYDLIVSKGIFLGQNERMETIFDSQPQNNAVKIQEIHKKYFKNPNFKHLSKLLSKSKISHDSLAHDRRMHLHFIQQAFEDLNETNGIESMLKFISISSNLKIIFDFNRDTVEVLDPTKPRGVMGSTHRDGYVYIAAKDLLEYGEKHRKVLGVLAQELCSYAIQLLYRNNFRPYRECEQIKRKKLNKIVFQTEAKKESEELFSSVFDSYDNSFYHVELIVRVPHLEVYYKDDQEKLLKVSNEFSELFRFYSEYVLKDFIDELPLFEAIRELINLNQTQIFDKILGIDPLQDKINMSFKASERILVISSNCPQLTTAAIKQQIKEELKLDEFSYIFTDFKTIANIKFFDLALKALKACGAPTLIVNCDNQESDEVWKIAEYFVANQIGKRIVFIADENFILIKSKLKLDVLKIEHSWHDLTLGFQQKLLQQKIMFQGNEIGLEDLIKDFSSIESIPLQSLLDDRMMHIGKVLTLENAQKLVERNFLLKNSNGLNSFTHDYDIEYNANEILEVAQDHQIVLLSDEPGMGKSASFKMLHMKLQKNQMLHWIVFMDLKEHYKSYQIDNRITIEFKGQTEITNFFCDKILNIQSFESQVFKYLFDNDRVVFLMDGLDEICPTYKNFIFNLISAIRRLSKNQLWISTRPHLSSELENLFQPLVLRLKSFTKNNRREFFRNILIRDNEYQNIKNKLEEIDGILDELKINSRCNSSNPLVHRLFAEICIYNYKPMNVNLFTAYNEFTIKMNEWCMEKGPESWAFLGNSFDQLNIEKFYQKIAFQICFDFGNRYKFVENLFFQMVITPSLEEIARVGLLYPDCFGRFHFLHRNLAEFYVAKFFTETIFAPERLRAEKELNAIAELLEEVLSGKYGFVSKMIGTFIDHAIESFEAEYDSSQFAISKKMCEKILQFDSIANMINDGFIKVIKTLCFHIGSGSKRILLARGPCGRNLLMVAFENQATGFIDQFISLISNFVSSDDLRNMFLEKDQFNCNVFHCAALNEHTEVFSFLLNQIDSFISRDELIELLLQKNFFGETVIHSALKLNRDLKNLLETASNTFSQLQLNILLHSTDNEGKNLFHFSSQCSKCGLTTFWPFIKKICDLTTFQNLLLQKDDFGFTPIQYAMTNPLKSMLNSTMHVFQQIFEIAELQNIVLTTIREKNPLLDLIRFDEKRVSSFFSFLKELFTVSDEASLKEMFLMSNEFGTTAFMFAVRQKHCSELSVLCSFLDKMFTEDVLTEILLTEDQSNQCALHYAALNYRDGTFNMIKNFYLKYFDDQIIREIMTKGDNDFLFGFMKNAKDHDNFIERGNFCDYLLTLFSDTKLETFFFSNLENGQTPLISATGIERKGFFQTIFVLSKKLFEVKVRKEILLQKYVGITALTLSASKYSIFEEVENCYHEIFPRGALQKIVLSDLNVENSLNSCMRTSSIDSFQKFCEYLKELFDGEEQKLKNLFSSFYLHDKLNMTKHGDYLENYIELLSSFATIIFKYNDLTSILMQTNLNKETLFHFSLVKCRKDSFKKVKNFYLKTLGREKMKSMIFEDNDFESILFYALDNISCEDRNGKYLLEEFFEFLRELFADDEPNFRKLISMKNNINESFIEHYKHRST